MLAPSFPPPIAEPAKCAWEQNNAALQRGVDTRLAFLNNPWDIILPRSQYVEVVGRVDGSGVMEAEGIFPFGDTFGMCVVLTQIGVACVQMGALCLSGAFAVWI